MCSFSSGWWKGQIKLCGSFKVLQREARMLSLLTDVIAAVREVLVQDARDRTARQVDLWTVTPALKTQVRAFNNWRVSLSFRQLSRCTQVKEYAAWGMGHTVASGADQQGLTSCPATWAVAQTGRQTGGPPLPHTFSETAILITTVQQCTFNHKPSCWSTGCDVGPAPAPWPNKHQQTITRSFPFKEPGI